MRALLWLASSLLLVSIPAARAVSPDAGELLGQLPQCAVCVSCLRVIRVRAGPGC